MATSVIQNAKETLHMAISNLETVNFSADYKIIILYRFFNGADMKAIYALDFSNTPGAVVNTFGNLVEVSFSADTGWTIKNNIDGAISVSAIR